MKLTPSFLFFLAHERSVFFLPFLEVYQSQSIIQDTTPRKASADAPLTL
jgi:hypothetical protein